LLPHDGAKPPAHSWPVECGGGVLSPHSA
jgi:hypothetical protein